MVHWTAYLVIGSYCLVAGWCTYKYYQWAKRMDQINADHFEYLKSPDRMIEGFNYWVAKPETQKWILGVSRFPVEDKEGS